jgi:glutaminase
VWALARLGWHVPAEVQAALLVQLQQVASSMNPQGLCNSVWALARQGWHVPAEVETVLLVQLQQAAASMTPQDVSHSVLALAHLGWHVPGEAQAALLSQLQQAASSMGSQAVSNSVWALGRLPWRVPEVVLSALFTAIASGDVQGAMNPQGVANTLHGLANMEAVLLRQVAVPMDTQAALCDTLAREASGMTAQGLANSVWALGQLHWHITQGVQSALEVWLMDRACELNHQNLSNLLLGLADTAAPLQAEVMARLLECVPATLLGQGSSTATMGQDFVIALYALAILSNLGVHVEARIIQGLIRRVAGMQLLTIGHRQVCAQSQR